MGRKDETWVGKARKGSRAAFDHLVTEYADLIFYLLYDLTGNYQDAQDLSQEAFIRAFQSLQTYRGDAKFSTWLYRIAYNVGIDFLRRERRIHTVEVDDTIRERELFHQGAVSSMEYTGEREAIDKALQHLSPSQRMAVVMHYFHGFTMKEISDILNCSPSTARVHLFRGLRHLKKKLKAFAPTSED